MEIPGAASALDAPVLREKADKRAEALLESLKQSLVVGLKDIGVLRKSMTVTVPADIVTEHIQSQFEDLRSDAIVPGFRKGRAPKALIQKRYGPDVRDSLKSSMVGQSYFAAVEKNELQVLGDPLFQVTTKDGVKLMEVGEAITHIEIPENADFTYLCELEVKPAIELPELAGIEIKTPQVEITDAMVDDAVQRACKIRGRYEPIQDSAAQEDDLLIADVTLKCDGAEVKREANLQLGVRPTRLDGVTLLDLGKKLAGAKVGMHITAPCVIPDDYERADLRGKQAEFVFDLHELKRLKPAAVSELVAETGARDEAQLREFFRDDLEAERDQLIQRAKREQVHDYLLSKVTLDLPEKLSARQTDRAVMRAVVELQQRGTPIGDIEARIDELRTVAKEQVARELRLQFILEKVAEKLAIKIYDEEVNTEIARIARRYNRRFDRVRDDLQREGLLLQLADQIRQDKAVAQILVDAKLVEVSEKAVAEAESKPSEKQKPKPAAKSQAADEAPAEAQPEPESKPKAKRKKAKE